MFTYTATIFKDFASAGLILCQLTSRPGWNLTYNNASDRATNEPKTSHLTSCNYPLKLTSDTGTAPLTTRFEIPSSLADSPSSACTDNKIRPRYPMPSSWNRTNNRNWKNILTKT